MGRGLRPQAVPTARGLVFIQCVGKVSVGLCGAIGNVLQVAPNPLLKRCARGMQGKIESRGKPIEISFKLRSGR